MSEVEVRPCTAQDVARLAAAGTAPGELRHHNERLQLQERNEAVYLVAWRGDEYAGRATLLLTSKYESVRHVLGDFPEINALEAIPQNKGTGTRLIAAAEAIAASRGSARIGLAADLLPDAGARRLYERLGYVEWSHGTVIDHWLELDDAGNLTAEHNEECAYLMKPLSAARG